MLMFYVLVTTLPRIDEGDGLFLVTYMLQTD